MTESFTEFGKCNRWIQVPSTAVHKKGWNFGFNPFLDED